MPSISPTLAMNQLSRKLEKEGKKVYKFGFGQSPFPVPEIFVEGIKKYASEKDYLPPSGLPELRKAIAEYYIRKHKQSFTPEQIVICPGSKMMLFLVRLCVDGYTILPSPSWVSYAPQAMALHKKIHWLHTSIESGWLTHPEDLDSFCKKNTNTRHLLILNYPSNPTGAIATASYLLELSKVCRKHRVVVVSDEIYKDLRFDEEYLSPSEFYPEGTIICDGISKWAGAGGHRLGYAIFPKEEEQMRQKVIALASETYSCVANPIQKGAVTLFEKNSQITHYQEDCSKILEAVAAFTFQKLQKLDISVSTAAGGFYLFPSFENYKELLSKRGIVTSEQLCEKMLAESGVALLNGTCFGRIPESLEARLSYVHFDGQVAIAHVDELSINHADEWLWKYTPMVGEGLQVLAKWLN